VIKPPPTFFSSSCSSFKVFFFAFAFRPPTASQEFPVLCSGARARHFFLAFFKPIYEHIHRLISIVENSKWVLMRDSVHHPSPVPCSKEAAPPCHQVMRIPTPLNGYLAPHCTTHCHPLVTHLPLVCPCKLDMIFPISYTCPRCHAMVSVPQSPERVKP